MAKISKAAGSNPASGEPARKFSPFSEVGVSGLKRFSGYVLEEFVRVLQGRRAAEIFREMRENDAVVNAMLFAIEYLARQVTWRVDPASQDQEDLKIANHIHTCLDDLSVTWADTIAEILSMLPYGWAYHEIVYKRRNGQSNDPTQRSRFADGLIGWRKVSLRSQDSLLRWDFDEEGGIQGMVQLAPPEYKIIEIPIDKSLLFRPATWKNNPEGRSILRGAYRSWYFLKRIQEYEAIGIERDLAGYPVVQPRLDINSNIMGPDLWNTNDPEAVQTLQQLQTFVRSVRRDEQEGAVIPGWLEFKLLSTGSRRQYDTDAIVTRYEQRVAMTTLADFILVGHEQVGSFALTANKTKLFGLALGAFLDAIGEVFNRHAIPRLMALNGWTGRTVPRMTHGNVDTPDLAALGAYVNQLTGAGINFTEPAIEAALLQAAHLPTTDVREVAKGNGHGKHWRFDPDRQEFIRAVQELREGIAKATRGHGKGLDGGNGHGAGVSLPSGGNGVTSVSKYITEEGGKWVVHAEGGKVLGRHDSTAEAARHLAIIERVKARKDRLPGGLGDEANPASVDQAQLEAGVKTEMEEHTDDPEIAREIALDHLLEDSQYYTHLEQMERGH